MAQAAYFLVTGLWPLLHIRSFMAVTGPKTDVWLVKTLALLIVAVGAVLLQAGVRNRVTPEVRSLGAGSALALMSCDAYYVAKGRISPVYLLDGAAEVPFAVAWLASLVVPRRVEAPPAPVMHQTPPA